MSVPRHTVQDPADLDTTAELPVLDVAAYEATHEQAGTAEPTTPAAAAAPELRSVEAAERSGPGPGSYRGRLEEDLRSLSANLREFEERLAAQGKRSAALESELESLRGVHSAAEQRAQGLSGELAGSRSALAASEARISALMQLVEQHETALRSTETRSAALQTGLAERERALASAERHLGEVRLQAAGRLEVLQSLEARRGVFDALLHDLDGEVTARDSRAAELQRGLESSAARARALETELAGSQRRAGELEAQVQSLTTALAQRDEAVTAGQRALAAAQDDRQRELEAAQHERQRQVAALDEEVSGLRAQLAERANALSQAEARHAERVARLEAGAGRVEELEGRIAEYAKAIMTLQTELGESRERLRAADGDVRAAEDTLLRLEGEVRAKNTRIEDLTRLNDDWRTTLEAARVSLGERDALIRRLEAEAAHSTALLDNIQHSIRSLESPPGGADETPAPTATRLLIRTEGETEVVHVLGRKTSIGRTPENDVQIDTKFISRHHAVILAGNVHTIIEDLNSTNGVVVNGQRVTRVNLRDGDAIIVGNAQFRFAVRPARNASEP